MEKIISILALLLLCMTCVHGQSSQQEVKQDTTTDRQSKKWVYDPVEEMPSFPGGMGALMQYLSENIKYPKEAEQKGIQGRVICSFVVEKNGSITDVKVRRRVDPSLDDEAVRVIKGMPKWIPGKHYGKPCRVRFQLPVTFKRQ